MLIFWRSRSRTQHKGTPPQRLVRTPSRPTADESSRSDRSQLRAGTASRDIRRSVSSGEPSPLKRAVKRPFRGLGKQRAGPISFQTKRSVPISSTSGATHARSSSPATHRCHRTAKADLFHSICFQLVVGPHVDSKEAGICSRAGRLLKIASEVSCVRAQFSGILKTVISCCLK